MKKLAAAILCLALGACGDVPSTTVETNDAPVIDTYKGIADETGLFVVDVAPEALMVQVWCTDLAGVRRWAQFDVRDDAVIAMCEPGGRFLVSVLR